MRLCFSIFVSFVYLTSIRPYLSINNELIFAGAQQQRNGHLVISAAAEPRREMSLQQRIRAFKFAVEEKNKQVATSPPVLTILAAIAAVRATLQPLFTLVAKLQQRWEAVGEAYNQFLAEETKSKWTWSKRNKKELALLAAFPPYTLGKKLKKNKIAFERGMLYNFYFLI
jgi:hypothetical protein